MAKGRRGNREKQENRWNGNTNGNRAIVLLRIMEWEDSKGMLMGMVQKAYGEGSEEK